MSSKIKNKRYYLGIDIGGTRIKADAMPVMSEKNPFGVLLDYNGRDMVSIQSPLKEDASIFDLIESLTLIIKKLNIQESCLAGIGISTGGIVDYKGTCILKAAKHLEVLKKDNWKKELEKKFNCNVTLINDADAAAIGMAEEGLLKGNRTIGIMPVGTGLGFTVWRNGRRWRPHGNLTLLGSIRLPGSSYDALSSASKFSELDKDGNLELILSSDKYKIERNEYLDNLFLIITTAAILYGLDEVIIGGGFAEAAINAGLNLENELDRRNRETPVELDKKIEVKIADKGNKYQLKGALMLAIAESMTEAMVPKLNYSEINTEIPYDPGLQLQKMSSTELVKILWEAEQEAGKKLESSLNEIAFISEKIARKLKSGGRLIYVGSGTSGRLAALDAVEIPCTYGFPENRILTVIAGGIADASIEIESDFEEDASSTPEMLLLNIKKEDVIVGISASGSAYFVLSALALAKLRGAYSILIQEQIPKNKLSICDQHISLQSGNEIVAGSTRMKCGTATKKVLNFLSTTTMILLGKVHGSYMIDLACINNKLVERAQAILKTLFDLSDDEAMMFLEDANMELGKAIAIIQSKIKGYEGRK